MLHLQCHQLLHPLWGVHKLEELKKAFLSKELLNSVVAAVAGMIAVVAEVASAFAQEQKAFDMTLTVAKLVVVLELKRAFESLLLREEQQQQLKLKLKLVPLIVVEK